MLNVITQWQKCSVINEALEDMCLYLYFINPPHLNIVYAHRWYPIIVRFEGMEKFETKER